MKVALGAFAACSAAPGGADSRTRAHTRSLTTAGDRNTRFDPTPSARPSDACKAPIMSSVSIDPSSGTLTRRMLNSAIGVADSERLKTLYLAASGRSSATTTPPSAYERLSPTPFPSADAGLSSSSAKSASSSGWVPKPARYSTSTSARTLPSVEPPPRCLTCTAESDAPKKMEMRSVRTKASSVAKSGSVRSSGEKPGSTNSSANKISTMVSPTEVAMELSSTNAVVSFGRFLRTRQLPPNKSYKLSPRAALTMSTSSSARSVDLLPSKVIRADEKRIEKGSSSERKSFAGETVATSPGSPASSASSDMPSAKLLAKSVE
mmetsp:Transcript_12570/g.41445  ORF Transcript_12570/g.41445 Transcript_12570/m.41445 type:complete len:321 (+) Transcript_12570:511-1473(+)